MKFYIWQKILIYMIRHIPKDEINVLRLASKLDVTYQACNKSLKMLIQLGFMFKRMKIGRDTPVRLTDEGRVLAENMNNVYAQIGLAFKNKEK